MIRKTIFAAVTVAALGAAALIPTQASAGGAGARAAAITATTGTMATGAASASW